MEYIKKKIASWEIKYGQIAVSSRDYEIAKKLFRDYFGTTFKLETFKGNFSNRHFLDAGYGLRLSCKPFFSKLDDGDTIYLQPLDQDTIKISMEEPTEKIEKIEGREVTEVIPPETSADITKLLVELVKENKALRADSKINSHS